MNERSQHESSFRERCKFFRSVFLQCGGRANFLILVDMDEHGRRKEFVVVDYTVREVVVFTGCCVSGLMEALSMWPRIDQRGYFVSFGDHNFSMRGMRRRREISHNVLA